MTLPATRADARPEPWASALSDTLGRMTDRPAIELFLGDIVRLRRSHPCGGDTWLVDRLGADIGLRCQALRPSRPDRATPARARAWPASSSAAIRSSAPRRLRGPASRDGGRDRARDDRAPTEGALAVFKNRPFLLLWLAQAATQIGGNMVIFGLTVIIAESTGSTTAVSALILTFLAAGGPVLGARRRVRRPARPAAGPDRARTSCAALPSSRSTSSATTSGCSTC